MTHAYYASMETRQNRKALMMENKFQHIEDMA